MYKNQPYKYNIISYHGPFTVELISFLANHMQAILVTDRQVIKKIFKVFIELTQNVSYYSAQVRKFFDKSESRGGIGWVTVDENEHAYIVATGNVIQSVHGPILDKNCKEINSLNDEDLRDLKRKTRMQANIRDIGAHIGLIHTGLISGNKLDFSIEKIDNEFSFFKIQVKIDKLITN